MNAIINLVTPSPGKTPSPTFVVPPLIDIRPTKRRKRTVREAGLMAAIQHNEHQNLDVENQLRIAFGLSPIKEEKKAAVRAQKDRALAGAREAKKMRREPKNPKELAQETRIRASMIHAFDARKNERLRRQQEQGLIAFHLQDFDLNM